MKRRQNGSRKVELLKCKKKKRLSDQKTDKGSDLFKEEMEHRSL